jgi:GntR family transcriptional repressor for pyruvate dehydrogenase complex
VKDCVIQVDPGRAGFLNMGTAMTRPADRVTRVRVADQIVEDLRRQILSGELADGSKVASERDLAAEYGVSAPTVREAVRVLTAMGLLRTSNGSRSVVTATADALLSMSIASVVQFEKMAAADVFGLLRVLNTYAVELAVDRASDEDIAGLRAAAERAGEQGDVESESAALVQYFLTLAAISHNPLLAALCRIITVIQVGLSVELSKGSAEEWGAIPRSLHQARVDIVDAVAARDSDRAARLMHEYHDRVVDRIRASPGASRVREADPDLAQILGSWLGSNIGIGIPHPALIGSAVHA